MKSVPKLIKRFIGILLLSTVLILVLNIAVIFFIGLKQMPNSSPYAAADETASSLTKTDSGYILDSAAQKVLDQSHAWAIFIDNDTHRMVWHTDNLPDGIPSEYSLADVSSLTLGYLKDCPTYVGENDYGIMVLGYPADSYWKSMWPSWDYHFIADLPQTILIAFLCNIFLIFIIYITVVSRLIKSVNPIICGLNGLTSNEPVTVQEKGVFSELARCINQTSATLQAQDRQLKKRETARANWIAGVSHDIRTPLSMVMGYAGQLENAPSLSEDERKKAYVILKQSEKMSNLINDLNLASKLEYNMQPIHLQSQNAVALIRQVVVDFLNTDAESKYPIHWETDSELHSCIIQADGDLIKRAVSNLISNSINHNENGCSIYVCVQAEQNTCVISVEDDGVGASDEQIEKLNTASHYMVCDENITEQQHGLGLLLVKQIAASHNSRIVIGHSKYNGFAVSIILPL
ncbi:MAG: two-component sensor histidine kinase [Erysipelotrichia bacterium]|nr:two-component sensor histidine kinase [Erysipelotrichia bacterium]